MEPQIAVGKIVKITRPKYTQGGTSAFQDRLAKVKWLKGRSMLLVVLGESESYMFFESEVDLVL